jgi:hypothetical protein
MASDGEAQDESRRGQKAQPSKNALQVKNILHGFLLSIGSWRPLTQKENGRSRYVGKSRRMVLVIVRQTRSHRHRSTADPSAPSPSRKEKAPLGSVGLFCLRMRSRHPSALPDSYQRPTTGFDESGSTAYS